MEFITSNIGSAKDNLKSPIHNWYKFTAGFSYTFVEEIIKLEKLSSVSLKIFDPFAGCGTTLVSSQKKSVLAVGNEAQEFMYDVIRAKLDWGLEENKVIYYLKKIKDYVTKNIETFDPNLNTHELLKDLYSQDSFTILYLIKNRVKKITLERYRLFFNLALSQTLHKVAKHPIAVPYISRNKTLNNIDKAWDFFESISRKMMQDIRECKDIAPTSKIYLHDSRNINPNIEDNSCSICVTSPPYLNNLDYGEVSKVHTHFFGITNNWSDITKKIRTNLVTGSTTHYREADFDLEKYKKTAFFENNYEIGELIVEKAKSIKSISQVRAGRKSFDILTLLYFEDMYKVLNEIYRVIKKQGKAYLILGDSAPYGIHIPTTEILGKIARNVGFSDYQIHKIRSRGTKWKSLTYRHSLELAENVLILK